MILEILHGIIVSIAAYFFFIFLRYASFCDKWLIETAKFIYYSGHPLYDDDKKFSIVTSKFKKVFFSFAMVVFKTLVIIILLVALTGIFSFIFFYIGQKGSIHFSSAEIVDVAFPPYLLKLPFIAGSLIPIIIILMLPKKEKEEDVYSGIDKLLHYVFLGNNTIAKMLFKIEVASNKNSIRATMQNRSVYISGLARSGTTVLTQTLGKLPGLISLSYRNLPFLFLPKTWPRLFKGKRGKTTERAHKDGIKHNLDSHEALEEPFWRHYLGKDYIKEDFLLGHAIDTRIFLKYQSFRKLVAQDKIYLAKNNNHLLRASSLHSLDVEHGNTSITFITFREPYSHAASLLSQHLNLSALQQKDDFVLDYMDFLVHHEFGLNQKVTNLNTDSCDVDFKTDKTSLEYWLEVWYFFYKKAITIYSGKTGFYFFSFENFCKKPVASILSVTSLLGIPKKDVEDISVTEFTPKRAVENTDITNKYSLLYQQLIIQAINNEN